MIRFQGWSSSLTSRRPWRERRRRAPSTTSPGSGNVGNCGGNKKISSASTSGKTSKAGSETETRFYRNGNVVTIFFVQPQFERQIFVDKPGKAKRDTASLTNTHLSLSICRDRDMDREEQLDGGKTVKSKYQIRPSSQRLREIEIES